MTFQESVEWLEAVPLYGHKDGLNNMLRLMEKLGNPQYGLRVIHVAGTNGKGSCCSMLHNILMEAGYRTGLYTSPHLMDYRERIRVQKDWISEERFTGILERVRKCNEELVSEGYPHATYFEFLTAVAFTYFAEEKTDFVVLETGVGGRLDATNVVKAPVACLITSISLDHTKVLGNTLEAIAGEKAGIIKPGRPVILSANEESVVRTVRKYAKELQSPFYDTDDCRLRVCEECREQMELALVIPDTDLPERFLLPMVGDYQLQNTAAVLKTVKVLRECGLKLDTQAVSRGLETVRWPGRMQTRSVGNRYILLEGAHNEDGASWLGRYIGRQKAPVTLVFSALAKKDTSSIVSGITAEGNIAAIYFAPLKDELPLTAEAFEQIYRNLELHIPYSMFASVSQAMDAAVSDGTDRMVVCAGSLYLVGEVMSWLEDRR